MPATLWPEWVDAIHPRRALHLQVADPFRLRRAEKLYGHAYDLISIAASHDGSCVATACRAADADHANILIFSSKTWRVQGEPLRGHNLTITSMRFRHDDKYLLSVSRYRSWHLFAKDAAGGVSMASIFQC